jgi:two-component system response regulator FixJ
MIFVVDDDGGARDSLRLLLECDGLEARKFASCEAFLNDGGAGEGDCLILDVHMPGMSGIELLETMRRRGDMLPVILISGRTDTTTRNRARTAGAFALLEKPYQAEEVLDLVRRALDHG